MTTIAVIGTGAMGRGIMQWALEAGGAVVAVDAREGAALAARDFIVDMFNRAVAKGRTDEATRDAMLGRLTIGTGLADVAPADIVIEAIVEDLGAKRALFAELETIVSDDAILCTNTSSLSVTSCARDCRLPGRVAGLHFFNPVPLMKVVEVIRGERTQEPVIDALLAFVAGSTHKAVVCVDSPGFVVNHAGRGLNTEGLRVVQEGVATHADVDRVMRDCAGFPMGPFELFDLTGLDVSSRVMREIYDAFMQEPRFRPSPFVARRVDAGLFGRKSGEGFYRYLDGRKVDAPEMPSPPLRAATVYVDGPAAVRDALARGGLMAGSDAATAEIVVVCPYGSDATTAAVDGGFDARKVVAIDPLHADKLAEGGRASLMGTPATDPAALDAVHAALLAAGCRVTRHRDSPGFIAQRILAHIVNVACEIAQQRIAAPDDIENGVRLGLGYPAGPLSLGDAIGPARILEILEGIEAATGDPRYRPSLWLRRRARLGLSLKQTD